MAAGGEVEIVSEPPGAAVTIDDRPVGHAPIGPNLLSPGPHRIELMLPGFGLESRRITLAEGQSQVVRAELAPVHLDVRLRGLSEDLSVSLDGELVSADGEWIRQVPPGWHDLAASRGGVEVWARRLRVGTDGGNELRVDAAASGGVSPTRGVRRWGGLAAAAAGLLAAAALMPEPGGGIADYAAPAGLATVGAAAAIVSIVAWTESGASLRAAPSPRLDR